MRKAYAISSLLRIAVIAIALFAFAAVLEASDNFTVNYNTNQSITAFSTCKKVTNNSGTGLSVYVPTNSAEEWLSFYTNPPAGVSIGSCSITVPAGTNLDLCALAGNPTTPGTYVFTIDSGTTVNSSSTSQAALTTGTCWVPGSTITLINSGTIYGRGGDGGAGGTYTGLRNGSPGGNGGPAVGMSYPLTIENTNGYILGGGGGGGGGAGGGGGRCHANGGGGGGGQGSVNSSGGSPNGGTGTLSGAGSGGPVVLAAFPNCGYLGFGGNGGAFATAGSSGSTFSTGGAPGPGGTGGPAVTGSSYGITWQGGNDATHVKGAVQ